MTPLNHSDAVTLITKSYKGEYVTRWIYENKHDPVINRFELKVIKISKCALSVAERIRRDITL